MLAPEALGRQLDERETALFVNYLTLLTKWQKSQRLVGSVDSRWIQQELFADALIFSRFIPPPAVSLLDFGSGAGIPGIPLKIVRPTLDVVLLESKAKRVSFLRTAVRELGLSGVRVAGTRAEDAVSLHRQFDVITARCAGRPTEVVAAAAKFLAPGGILLLAGAPRPIALMGVSWEAVSPPGLRPRQIGIYRET